MSFLSRPARLLILLFSTFVIAACGGGGSEGGDTSASKRDQVALQFEVSEAVIDFGGQDTFENGLSGGSGGGIVTFSSTDSTVATVNAETGLVSLVGPGMVTIQATKADDAEYNSATATYALAVRVPALSILAEIGKQDSVLNLESFNGELEFYRYTNADCDLENYASCSDSTLSIISSEAQLPLLDDYIGIELPAYVELKSDKVQAEPIEIRAERPAFTRRMGQAMVSFNGKLLVIGGQDNSAGESGNDTYWYSDIWSTTDGIHWIQETTEAKFGGRAFHEVVEYNNALYMISGEVGSGIGGASSAQGDVWKSHDGVTWENILELGEFGPSGKAVVFDGKLWVIGDGAFSGRARIYSTTDGVNWDLEVEEAPFGSREGQAVYEWQSKLYVAAGMDEDGSDSLLSDVWSSPDGRIWTKESVDGGFGARVHASVLNYEGRLMMIGGHPYSEGFNNVFVSDDGVNWSLLQDDIIETMNQYHSAALFNEKIWLYSGLENDYLWSSEDGSNWRIPAEFPLEWNVIAD